jgi:2-methylaconitate cis-trans-isomerase PrpF
MGDTKFDSGSPSRAVPADVALPCSIYRGGTSRAIMLHARDLPAAGERRDHILKQIMGTPHQRQIDGLGGAHPATSKLAIIGIAPDGDADIDYNFAQMGIDADEVDWSGNCGNISSAAAPFAINEGLIAAQEPITSVRIRNVNTGTIFTAHVPVTGGKAATAGDYRIDGVPGTGAEIAMDYSNAVGTKTGKLLPTGNPVDQIVMNDGAKLDITICDFANPMVFVAASDLGINGTESSIELEANAALLDRQREVRGRAAALLGFSPDWQSADQASPIAPLIIAVAPMTAHKTMQGSDLAIGDGDLVARVFFMGTSHGSMAGTGALCLGAASRIKGSVVWRALSAGAAESPVLKIAHPSGIMNVNAEDRVDDNGLPVFRNVGISRTARLIMSGTVYVRSQG